MARVFFFFFKPYSWRDPLWQLVFAYLPFFLPASCWQSLLHSETAYSFVLRAEVPTLWPLPGGYSLVIVICLGIYQYLWRGLSHTSSHGFKTRWILSRFGVLQVIIFWIKVHFPLYFPHTLNLLCAWLLREKHGLKNAFLPGFLPFPLYILIIHLFICPPSLLPFFPFSLISFFLVLPPGHFLNLHQRYLTCLVSYNICHSLSEERPFIFKMTTDLFLDKLSIQFWTATFLTKHLPVLGRLLKCF